MSPIGSVYTIFHESRRAARRRFCHEDRLQREKEPLFREKKRCDIEFVRPRRRCALAGLSSTRGRSQRPFVEKLASVAPIGSLSRSKQRGNGPLLSHGDLLGRVALPRRFVDTSKKPDGFINPAGDEAARVKICKKWSELTSLLLGGELSIMEYVSGNGF